MLAQPAVLSPVVMATLPEGFRPAYLLDYYYANPASPDFLLDAIVTVHPSGDIELAYTNVDDIQRVAIDLISFRTS